MYIRALPSVALVLLKYLFDYYQKAKQRARPNHWTSYIKTQACGCFSNFSFFLLIEPLNFNERSKAVTKAV